MSFVVFKCKECGIFQFMSSKNRTKMCPKCGRVNKLESVFKISSFEAPALAVQEVAKLNEKNRGLNL